MTEYDYSPEAYEKYLATQNRIARWVDGTLSVNPRNPFTPATPAGQPLVIQRELEEYDDDERRSRHRSPPRHHREHREHREHRRGDRDREQAWEQDREYRHPSSRTRHRSPPHSGNSRATHTRSQTLPPAAVYPSGNRVRSPPRHSRHSSRSSETTRPRSSSTSANFPQNQLPWNKYSSAPAALPKPRRSYTNPAQQQHYPYAADKHHQTYPDQPVVIPLHPNNRGNTYNRPIDISNAPQLPYSAYQTQSPTKQPLLARLFSGLTGKHRSPRRKRSSDF